jgi:hypothetical protein
MIKKLFTPVVFLQLVCMNGTAQNVGIGTITPTRAKFEVNGAVDVTAAIFGGEGTGISLQRSWPAVGFNEYYNGGTKYIAGGYAAVQYFDPGNGNMVIDMFYNGAANGTALNPRRAVSILNSGNVGIRNGAGPASLWVSRGDPGNDGTAVFSGTTYNSHFNYSTAEDTYIRPGKNNGKVIINDVPGGKIAMGNGNTRVGINNGGDPQFSLEIRQAGNTGLALVSPNNNFDYWEMRVYNEPVVGYPGTMSFIYNGTWKSYIYYVDGSYWQLSDKRLKNNIQPMPSLMQKLMKLNPVTYDMKTNTGNDPKTSIGFIAQDVKALFPELVAMHKGGENGYNVDDLHMMNYSSFGVLAIKGIQEQQQQIESLRNENNDIKNEIAELRKLVFAITNK